MPQATGIIRIERHEFGITLDIGDRVAVLTWEQLDGLLDGLYSMTPGAVAPEEVVEEKEIEVTIKDV